MTLFSSTSVVILALSGSLVSGAVTPAARIVHERRSSPPARFTHVGPAPSDRLLNMRLNLAQRDHDGLDAALIAASDPASPKYGQWLSAEEVASYAAPSSEAKAAVSSWLASHGITFKDDTPSGDWIAFKVPVSKASELLHANYSIYAHESGKEFLRTLEYSLPAGLENHISAIHPTTSFFGPIRGKPTVQAIKSSAKIQPDAASSCSTTITPACLQSLYGIPTTAATNKSSRIGVAAFDEQWAIKTDLSKFLKTYRTDIASTTTFDLLSVDSGTNSQSTPGVEANLDIQYTVGVATGVPVTFISVGTNTQDGADEGFLDIITALLKQASPPQVLTVSYGLNTEADLSKSLTIAMCNSYQQLASQGVSILYATGDGGVAATPGESCSKTFNPTFPTCPYITLVGATGGVPEVGADLSAGGFSNYYPTQSWQASAVSKYLSLIGTEYSGKFNASGRAYPDVSAQGESVVIINGGSAEKVDGTSCSSPIFASVIGLLNSELLSAGKPVLGFLNPWLYANPQAFNDITSGSNPGCGTTGFPAKAGWDPVTGLGTPAYPKLRTAAGLV